ncbi:MAG: hypothetical protein JRI25_23515, partial [Deltaproteobacteria bacterium]|nr:hypothetical protein [Deltaproteobacteria bacterium]
MTIASEPECPSRFCELSNEEGDISAANVTNVTVTCVVPRVMLVAANWALPHSIFITDDLHSLGDGATAAPRVIEGANTQISSPDGDSVAVDRGNEVIYVADWDGQVLVFNDARTAVGDITPDRIITVPGAPYLAGMELDMSSTGRLYLTGWDGADYYLWIYDDPASLNGTITPDQAIEIPSARALSLDLVNDRLFVSSDYDEEVYVFDNASLLATGATPNRTVTWTNPTTGFAGPSSVWLDSCTDRLYVNSNSYTAAGNYLAVFENASTLDGVVNLDTDSDARLALEAISV